MMLQVKPRYCISAHMPYFNTQSRRLPIGAHVTLRPPDALPDAPEAIWCVEALYGAKYPHDAVISLKEVSGGMAFRVMKNVNFDQIREVAA